jgi:hypothetical protein
VAVPEERRTPVPGTVNSSSGGAAGSEGVVGTDGKEGWDCEVGMAVEWGHTHTSNAWCKAEEAVIRHQLK